jgi:hypothetical protein
MRWNGRTSDAGRSDTGRSDTGGQGRRRMEEDLAGRETVIHFPSDRSLSSRATALGGTDGATVATLATALGRVPTNQTRRPPAGVKTRMTGRTAERKDEHHGPSGLSGTPGTGRHEAYPRRGASG